MQVLGAAQIAERLSRRFELLKTRTRGVAPRHATLEGAIDWSWQMLDEDERRMLALCAVFRGGFDFAAARDVLAMREPRLLDALQNLCDHSLMRAEEQGGRVRYRLYESVRDFAVDKSHPDDVRAVAERHDAYYTALAVGARLQIYGTDHVAGMATLETELDNFLSVHARGLASDADAVAAQRVMAIAFSLEPLLMTRGPVRMLKRLMDSALAYAEAAGSRPETHGFMPRIMRLRANVLAALGRRDDAKRELASALSLSHAQGDAWFEGRVRAQMALEAWRAGDLDKTLAAADEAITLHRAARDHCFEGRSLVLRARALALRGDRTEAEARIGEAQSILSREGDPLSQASAIVVQADIDRESGRLDRAAERLDRALVLVRSAKGRFEEGALLVQIARLALDRDDVDGAKTNLRRAEAMLEAVGNQRWDGVARALRARIAEREGNREAARSLYAGAVDLLRTFALPSTTGAVLCAWSRLEADDGDASAAARHLADAERLLAVCRAKPLADLVQATRAHLGGESEAPLRIDAGGRTFCIPGGDVVDISRRRALRLVLKALADAHDTGAALTLDALVEAGWPGEDPQPEAAANRVYNAITQLRSLGLKPYLLRRDDGYVIDPGSALKRD